MTEKIADQRDDAENVGDSSQHDLVNALMFSVSEDRGRLQRPVAQAIVLETSFRRKW